MTYLELIKCYNLEIIWSDIVSKLGEKRLVHVKGVIETAYELAAIYGADSEKAVTAAVFHDCFRGNNNHELNDLIDFYGLDEYYKDKANLSHGLLAKKYMEERYGIIALDLLNAVCYHTTGRAGMSLLDKIVFLADAIEPSRTYRDVQELRRQTYVDLDAAVIRALKATIDYVRAKGELLDEHTLQAYHDLTQTHTILHD
jgi:predicted HD superfamily hydrolase involved in NAD metabolism